MFQRIAVVFSKRNPIVNILLSLLLVMTVVISFNDLALSVGMLITTMSNGDWSVGVAGIFYSICGVVYLCRFVLGNHKNAVIPSFIGSVFIWFPSLVFLFLVIIPESVFIDEEGQEYSYSWLIIYALPLLLTIMIEAIVFAGIYWLMKMEKDGVSAWSLLDVRKGNPSRFEKLFFLLFAVFWILPVGVLAFNNYKVHTPKEDLSSYKKVAIGDYYYEDGTFSSELLSDKKVIGVVFSLETSASEKEMGFTRGQIVAIKDASERDVVWDEFAPIDYEEYPDFTWENRLEALKDLDGYGYIHNNMVYNNKLNLLYHNGFSYSNSGISEWYIPTAGQWAQILENLGKVKVDRMLKLDAATASQNLKKFNINPNRWYWTITEFDAEYAWSIRLNDGEFGSRSDKRNKAYIRPVASF